MCDLDRQHSYWPFNPYGGCDLAGLEIYLLITGAVMVGIGVAGVAMGSAANGVAVAIGVVLLACWAAITRRRRERR